MVYHALLGLIKEPFSTSPDPEFFYLTREHEMALTHILIDLRLRRGLSVILGDIGTGKTTLSRKLVQELKKRPDILFHMILNPDFENDRQLLVYLIRSFSVDIAPYQDVHEMDAVELRDAIERFLIQKAVMERKIVVLIIDEAQKLDPSSLESLRLLLNFETNEYKLIQLVLLGQLELYARLMTMTNFLDRISFRYTLNPLDEKETRSMIHYRLVKAGYHLSHDLFQDEAIDAIYQYSLGYPRRVNMLCHKILKELVVRQHTIVDRILVKEVIEREKLLWTETPFIWHPQFAS